LKNYSKLLEEAVGNKQSAEELISQKKLSDVLTPCKLVEGNVISTTEKTTEETIEDTTEETTEMKIEKKIEILIEKMIDKEKHPSSESLLQSLPIQSTNPNPNPSQVESAYNPSPAVVLLLLG
jgi:hypothetical protein